MRKLLDREKKLYSFVARCDKLLDHGCDKGDFTGIYLGKAKKVCAVDINKKHLDEGKKNYPKIEFKLMKNRIPYSAHTFDVVTSSDVIEHMKDEKGMIKEIHRVLKKGGYLVLSTPHYGLFHWFDPFNLKYVFPKLYKWWKGKYFDPKI